MTYNEITTELNEGKVIKSQECMYIKPTDKSPIYWKWIGEDTWTIGNTKFDECTNDSEKNSQLWEVLFDPNLVSY